MSHLHEWRALGSFAGIWRLGKNQCQTASQPSKPGEHSNKSVCEIYEDLVKKINRQIKHPHPSDDWLTESRLAAGVLWSFRLGCMPVYPLWLNQPASHHHWCSVCSFSSSAEPAKCNAWPSSKVALFASRIYDKTLSQYDILCVSSPNLQQCPLFCQPTSHTHIVCAPCISSVHLF